MMVAKYYRFLFGLVIFLIGCATTNLIGAKYYHLLEKERPVFLGLRAIDSLSAMEYINLASPVERKYFYEQYWQNRDKEREEFEKRTEYAFKEFGRYAPLSDERISVYVRYGSPSRRYNITPGKKIGIVTKEFINPAEIWTYNEKGIEFDFVRITRAYKMIAQTTFGDSAIVPFLKEEKDSNITLTNKGFKNGLKCDISIGRFRQAKNLVRLEIYTRVFLKDAKDDTLIRVVRIYDKMDSLMKEKITKVFPSDTSSGIFYYDEVNLWLPPVVCNVVVEYYNLKTREKVKKEIEARLLDYKEDAKKESDLVFAQLIDDGYTDEKFYKSPGRVIPLFESSIPVGQPFYLYHELYNLKLDEQNMHSLKTQYEIYNKEKMYKELVDILVQTEMNESDVAYLSAKYHPMDLPAGQYIIVVKTIDLISGEEYSAVGEFVLKPKDK